MRLGTKHLDPRRGPLGVVGRCSYDILCLLPYICAQRLASRVLHRLPQRQIVLHQKPHKIMARHQVPRLLCSAVLIHPMGPPVPLRAPRSRQNPGHVVEQLVGQPPSKVASPLVNTLRDAAESLPHPLHNRDVELLTGRAGCGRIRINSGIDVLQDVAAVVLTARLCFLHVHPVKRVQQWLHSIRTQRSPHQLLLFLRNGHFVGRTVFPSDASLVQAPRPREQPGLIPRLEQGEHFLGLQNGALELLFEVGERDHLLVGFLLFHPELIVAEGTLPYKGLGLVQAVDLTVSHNSPHHSPHRGPPGPRKHQGGRARGLLMVRNPRLLLFESNGVDIAAVLLPVSGAGPPVALAVGAEKHSLVHIVVVVVNGPQLLLHFRLKSVL
mmetsp:Transcript_49715/g.112836  ORF Transcript_49715/g.112836 Transcript_49715/m.112836 type:complete len:382 (-) Transcript_49715:205-1350(-)